MVGTTWVYSLKKDELIAYLEEFGLDSSGTVEELRRRFAQFVGKCEDTQLTRIEELAVGHSRVSTNVSTGDTQPSKRNASTAGEFTSATVNEDPLKLTQTVAYPWVLPSVYSTATLGNNITSNTYSASNFNTVPGRMPILESTVRPPDLSPAMDKVRKWSVRYGGGPEALAFVERIEELADLYSVRLQDISRIMSELLQDQALTWYRCNKRIWLTWPEFKSEFLKFFLPPRYFEDLEDTIRQRHQVPRETFKAFTIAMQDLMRHTTYTEEQKLERIHRNSRQEYQLHIKRREFNSLAELIELAGDFEVIKSSTVGSRPLMEKTRMVTSNDTPCDTIDVRNACRRCGQTGHFKHNCRNLQVLFCWQCGKRGRRTLECCRKQQGNERGNTTEDRRIPRH